MSRLTIVLSVVVGAAFVVVVVGYGNSWGNSSEPTATPVSVGEHQNHDGYDHGDHQGHEGHDQHAPTAEIAAYLETQAHAPMGGRMAVSGQKVCPMSGQSRATMAKARKANVKAGGGSSCCGGSGSDPCADEHGTGQRRNVTDGDSGAHRDGH